MVEVFILQTIANYFGIQSTGDVEAQFKENVMEFVGNPHIMVLQVFMENNTMHIVTEIKNPKSQSILFYKTSPQELTQPDSANFLNIITLSTPAESLYQMLRHVYSPLLSEANDVISNDIQQNLQELEANLRTSTQKTGANNVVLSIEDEVNYWMAIAENKQSSKKEREAAAAFRDTFQDINEEIKFIQSSAMSENRTNVESIGGMLDDIWRHNSSLYTQDRMKHIIDVISFSICSIIRNGLTNEDLWDTRGGTTDSNTLLPLSDCVQVVQTWIDACKSLTETYWPNYAMHPWDGKPYVSKYCGNFETRLSKISDITSVYNQLVKLLTSAEREELKTDQMFEPFKSINVWNCNENNKAWESAEARFSTMLRPAEGKVADKLKPRLHNTSTKQMLHEFLRYKSLISRPTVKQLLSNELEVFVTLLVTMVTNIQSQLNVDDSDVRMYQPMEMSSVVQQVQWAKQMEAKVIDIQTCAEKYLSDFEESHKLSSLAAQVAKELRRAYTQLHEDWSRDLQAQVKGGSLQLSLDKPVVEFSNSNNMMVVNFDPKAVSVGLEARSLAALGLPPPAAVLDALDGLAKLLHHARYLQQVASFHNTMGERMIPSTRPMMLQAALDLSSLVQDQKAVYWHDEQQVASYTDKLKKAVMKLESQNSYLTTQHTTIRSIVSSLVEIELLSKQNEWKKKINEIRDVIEKVENNGYKNTDAWRTHWDWQLYKALECQYMKTLLSLHKHFPTVRVDLVLRGRSVQTYPPLEEIRIQHYHQLRRFIALPTQFVGLNTAVTETPSIFNAIVEKHSWMGNKSVIRIESTLSALERLCAEWSRKAALACVSDLEQLCADNLKVPKDWETNFKACKAYGQAVAKITFEDEKVDWITVGTASLRREFEAQVRTLWACLISSLQTSCRDDTTLLDSFMANATLTLENKALPKNAKELAEISAKQQALNEKMPQMTALVEDLKQKSHMLRTWGGDPSVDNTLKEWQRIHELMITNQQLFEHHAEIVKSSLTGEWENINTNFEAWFSRWCQNKSRYEDTRSVTYAEMLVRCGSVFEAQEALVQYCHERDEMIKEWEKFNMKLEVPVVWQEAEKTLLEDTRLWAPLKEYHEEYKALAEQEWIVFQKKLHMLDELVSKWVSNLEPFTTVTLFLQQELGKYSDLTPLLKYLRGTDFTELHWREIYSLLGMECKKADSLLVKDLLDVSLNIKKHVKTLQKISATAISESAIRSTLNELELWFAGARLAVTYYKDKTQQSIPIVKDFKEILAKIEEQQWAVSAARGGGGGVDATSAWESRLRAAVALLRSLHHAQRRWLYLEPILSSDEGDLGAKFRKVDIGFKQVARTLETDPRLSALLKSSRLQPMLESILEQLHACQSALDMYIDDKRSIFPRLYFLSDDDLLELLGQARAGSEGREVVMQMHLKKLFPGITGVKLGPNGMSITALRSLHGDALPLGHPIDIDCPVEVWLKNLEAEMRSSLKAIVIKSLSSNVSLHQDPFSLPTQVICLAQNIRFTEQVEKAIAAKDLYKLQSNIDKENAFYMEYEVENESETSKRQAVILQCAHYMDVIKVLIENSVVTTNDWFWQKQLRFYMVGKNEVVARMGLAEIEYSYEYLGVNTGHFVRTELANECFLILTQALHLGLVGNPFGPAGTGKTESVKALGGLVGRLVLVFNCDEAMDSQCMGRLLTGLAVCGAWGCFDELNRLSADTLADVSHQFAAVMQRENVVLNQKKVCVSVWCGVACTLNPLGRGYGGRRALPAALQRSLRPVAMLAPRPPALAAHLLAARAVPHAKLLAHQLYTVFDMAGELVTSERHYDWGLRALKAAVGSAGAALGGRGAPRTVPAQRAVLRRLLALNNLPKLTRHDAARFEEILSLVFSDVPPEELTSNPIMEYLEMSVKNLGLIHNKLQLQKCIEVYEQLQQRMGVVIVGAPGAGKTTIRQLLKDALKLQGKSVLEYVICPKAMSRRNLLGHIDHDTRQWTDGVISATALEVSNQTNEVWSWIVCDGDIDPEWIEALNSVLDDNRLLTLPSGWRIQFPDNVNFIFETHSLEHASPATITRMGIILLSDEDNYAIELLENWLVKVEIENEIAKMALPLLCKVVKKCLQWFTQHPNQAVIYVYGASLVKQILTQFEYVAQNIGVSVMNTSPEELIYTAVQRSVFGLLKPNALDAFREEISELLGLPPIQPLTAGEWVESDLYMSPRLARAEASIRAVVASSHSHLLVVAPDASAKNILTEYVLKDTNTSLVITIDCTPVLEPADIITELKRHNVVNTGSRGSALKTKEATTTLFVRGLQRAACDQWGSSPVSAFLLQIIHHGGFWECGGGGGGGESAGAQWCGAGGVRVAASLSPASPAPRLCPRLACSLHTVTIPKPDGEELSEVVTKHLRKALNKNITDKVIASTQEKIMTLYQQVTENFTSRSHYRWNANDLKKLCENLKWHETINSDDLSLILLTEADKIFKNRLVTETEKAKYDEISKNCFNMSREEIYFIPKLRGAGVVLEMSDKRNWTQHVNKIINQCLTEQEHSVFGNNNPEACAELSVLCPLFAAVMNGGVVAAVGSPGVGRRAAARIVATALSANVTFVNHSTEFNTQFKNALSSCGIDGSRTLVVVGEAAVTEASLGHIEALTKAGTVHNVPRDMMPSRSQSQNDAMFIENLKHNLGIIIMLDKDQYALFDLIGKYPMLYQASYMVWLDRWCDDTLRQMPINVIQRLRKETLPTEGVSVESEIIPVDGFVAIHKSLDVKWMLAPCRYANFIRTYYTIFCMKKTELVQRQSMLSSGVEALRRARSEVAKLKADAAEQEVALGEKQAAANHALEQIGATVRAATDKKEEMHELKINIEKENEALQIRKNEIEAELAAVEPVIAAARAAVGELKPESLSEVRSLRAPPDVVRDVLEGVLRLMGIADTSWHSMKSFLSKRGVMEDIRCLDASQISEEAAESVRRLLERRGASFEERTARRASAACAPLAAWVRANLAYVQAARRVRPLQQRQRDLASNLREAEGQLEALSSGLASVEERVSSLQQQLGRHSRDAAALELRLLAAAGTISAAAALLDQLADEYDAWETDLEHISKEIVEVSARSLLAAAYIVYLPDFTEPQARVYIKQWCSLIGFADETFSVLSFLASTERQLKWGADGLPSDQSAVKNAIYIDKMLESSKCGFTPLIIDPDGDAMGWLKNTLSVVPCDTISQQSDKLHTAVQYAVRLNHLLLVTEVDEIHPSWAPMLLGLPIGGAAGRVVLYSRDATLPNRLPPYRRAVLSVINFTARVDGLTDQLVHFALQDQNPQVNEKTREIKIKKASLQKQQHELQENLLKELSKNNDILNDVNLLASLKSTRASSVSIAEALQTLRGLEAAAAGAGAALGVAAARLAALALAVRELAARRPLLALPVTTVLQLFVEAIKTAGGKLENFKTDDVIKYVTRRLIERVLLGLHKKDKYIIVMHLLKQVYDDVIPDVLWQILLGNIDVLDVNSNPTLASRYTWIQDDSLRKLAFIEANHPEFYNKLSLEKASFWNEFNNSGNLSHLGKLQLSSFERVVAVALLRPDTLYRAIVAFIDEILGSGVMSRGGELRAGAGWGLGGRRPLLLLAAHATDHLANYALHTNHTLLKVLISDGREAWDKAVEEQKRGGWVCIDVGASPFTAELTAFLTNFTQATDADFGAEFRLWLVSEDREIPPLVSNACVNIILEAPEGMKNNMLSTLAAWGQYEHEDWRVVQLHVCLAYLHALLLERRAYIPQGWTRWYLWSWGEAAAGARVLRAAGAGAGGTARALVAALYGARVQGGHDARVLAAAVRRALPAPAARCLLPALAEPLPALPRLQAYTSALNALPDIDTPEMLMLPNDCRAAWEKTAAKKIIYGLKELNSVVNVTEIDDATSLKPLLNLWKKSMSNNPLLKGDPLPEMSAGGGGGGGVGWWAGACSDEARAARVAARALHAALAGAARHHSRRDLPLQVPEEWQTLWPGPLAPDRYIREFTHRANEAVKRMTNTRSEGFPKELDLSTFLSPRRVLGALRARAAAALTSPPALGSPPAPDAPPTTRALVLRVQWPSHLDRAHGMLQVNEETSVVIRGLHLSGAVWNGSALEPGASCAAPPLLFYYAKVEESQIVDKLQFVVPLFSSETREELLCDVPAPLAPGFDPAIATLNSVALFIPYV